MFQAWIFHVNCESHWQIAVGRIMSYYLCLIIKVKSLTTCFKWESKRILLWQGSFFVLNLLNSTCSVSLLRNITLHGFLAQSLNQRDLLCLEKLQKNVWSFGNKFPHTFLWRWKGYGKQILQGRNEVRVERELRQGGCSKVPQPKAHHILHVNMMLHPVSYGNTEQSRISNRMTAQLGAVSEIRLISTTPI